MTRQEKEDAAELRFKGKYCKHTAPDGSIDHGLVQSIAFWEGEYIVRMNAQRIVIQEESLDDELEIMNAKKTA